MNSAGCYDGAFVVGCILGEIGVGGFLASLTPPMPVKPVPRTVIDQCVEHHVLMVPLEKSPVRIPGLPCDEGVEDLPDGGAAIDIIAEENDGVFLRPQSGADDQLLHQRGQFDVMTVDVADREESAHEVTLPMGE